MHCLKQGSQPTCQQACHPTCIVSTCTCTSAWLDASQCFTVIADDKSTYICFIADNDSISQRSYDSPASKQPSGGSAASKPSDGSFFGTYERPRSTPPISSSTKKPAEAKPASGGFFGAAPQKTAPAQDRKPASKSASVKRAPGGFFGQYEPAPPPGPDSRERDSSSAPVKSSAATQAPPAQQKPTESTAQQGMTQPCSSAACTSQTPVSNGHNHTAKETPLYKSLPGVLHGNCLNTTSP